MSRSTAEIRRTFLDFFAERGHREVASGALVPANDPTLLFTNAGMVPFKDVFTGKETRDYARATTAQKCVRAGGKHNDLENVGFTPRHHTFFEMLGNFSFGDYFKEDAIGFAWKLLTEEFGIDADRLCVTVFKGEDGVPADDEAAEMWRGIGVPAERIFRLGKADNFWQMGDTGPQGPCSEIHYLMEGKPKDALVAEKVAESLGWMEIWNLVFMQFERATAEGPLEPLPRPSIDTGAGLERLAVVLQDKRSNYEIDLFQGLLGSISEAVGKPYRSSDAADDTSMRVIADHARATAFLVTDGVQPSNAGRGYVLRRIMRRAIRHGDRLGFKDLFFFRACLDVVASMKEAYPDLERARALIEKVAQSEETSFRQTLSRGLKLLEQRFEGGQALDAHFVATLYDTYGFPIDLTRVIAEERGQAVNEEEAQAKVREIQEPSRGGKLAASTSAVDKTWFDLRDAHGPTAFVGYEHARSEGKVIALLADGQPVKSLSKGQEGVVLLDRTPFYGESGGQVGDTGTLTFGKGSARVTDTQKPLPELHAHHVQVEAGRLIAGTKVEAEIDRTRLEATRRNHSATHLLHLALREVLGDHVQQKGSLVAPDRLRFDFAHFEPLTVDQQNAIEGRVNEMVLANRPTVAEVKSMDAARADGAMMLFGEKYGEEVRTVRIGGDSLELCGGLHVERSGDIGLFKLISESSLAAGIRRVEAVTGAGALGWVQSQSALLGRTAATMKVAPDELPDRVERLSKRAKQLERELEEARAQAALGGGGEAQDEIEELGGLKVLVKKADGTPRKALRPLADKLRDKLGSGVVIVTSKEEDKVALLVAATKDLKEKVHAGNLVKAAAAAMGGSGGGRPDFAQGGGPAEGLEAGLGALRAALEG
ncbi:MAG: alanine--tRNA ligase [Myxococcota bacterium]